MKIAVIDDYQNAFKTLKCFAKLNGHEVTVYTDPETDVGKLAERLKDADALVLTQQRTNLPRALIEKLPKLKLIGQTGRAATHVDLAACTEKGIVVSAGGSGNPNATAELTWGLILSSVELNTERRTRNTPPERSSCMSSGKFIAQLPGPRSKQIERLSGLEFFSRRAYLLVHPSFAAALGESRVQGIAQSVAEQVEAHQREENKQSRQKYLQRRDENIRRGVGQQVTPTGRRRLDTETEKTQRRLGADCGAGVESGRDNQRRQ